MPLAGYISDKVGYSRIMILSSLSSLMYTYPFFCIVYTNSLFNIVFAEILFLSFSQLFVAPINAFLTQLFPIRSRYTGMAFGYCVGMALFGGTIPYVSLSLINWSGNASFPYLYVMLICLIGLASVMVGKKYLSSTVQSTLVSNEI
jgi:MHS family proline/betaine transporter-like MFS transporter